MKKKEKELKIDWEGTADYLEEENRELKEDKFEKYIYWLVILIGLLFFFNLYLTKLI
jgi:hypothetical protein